MSYRNKKCCETDPDYHQKSRLILAGAGDDESGSRDAHADLMPLGYQQAAEGVRARKRDTTPGLRHSINRRFVYARQADKSIMSLAVDQRLFTGGCGCATWRRNYSGLHRPDRFRLSMRKFVNKSQR